MKQVYTISMENKRRIYFTPTESSRVLKAISLGYKIYSSVSHVESELGKDWQKYRHTYIRNLLLLNPEDKVR